MQIPALENKPPVVRNALLLLYVHLATLLAISLYVWWAVGDERELWVSNVWGIGIFVFIFSAALVSEIERGIDAGRILFVTLFCLELLVSIGISVSSPSLSPFRDKLFSLQAVLVSIACANLIQPDASAWFKEMKLATEERLHRGLLKPEEYGKLRDSAEWQAVPADQPLLVVRGVQSGNHYWRAIWMVFGVFFLGAVAGWQPPNDKDLIDLAAIHLFWVFPFGCFLAWFPLIPSPEISSTRTEWSKYLRGGPIRK